MPTFSPGWKPVPLNSNVVPRGPQSGRTVAFLGAGMPVQVVLGSAVGAAGGTVGEGLPGPVPGVVFGPYLRSYWNRPSSDSNTLLGACNSGCSSNTARSKYCTVYDLPST